MFAGVAGVAGAFSAHIIFRDYFFLLKMGSKTKKHRPRSKMGEISTRYTRYTRKIWSSWHSIRHALHASIAQKRQHEKLFGRFSSTPRKKVFRRVRFIAFALYTFIVNRIKRAFVCISNKRCSKKNFLKIFLLTGFGGILL